MAKQRIDPATLTLSELRKRLKRLQARMQLLWDGWQTWERTYPSAANASKKEFELLERDEAQLMELLRLKEKHDGKKEASGERD